MPAKSSIKREKNGRIVCTVVFDDTDVGPAEERAVRSLGAGVSLHGFRKGKAPLEKIRERLDADRLFEETIRELLSGALPDLVKEHDLKPIAPPRIAATSRSPVTLEVTFLERPPVRWKKGVKLVVEKNEPKADDKDVQRVIDSMLQREETSVSVDREAKEGDRLVIDFRGTLEDGTAPEGMTAAEYPVVLGSKSLIPGFEEQLIGAKKDDKREVKVHFPKEYHAKELAEKPATFAVTVREVQEVSRPELTDALAKERFNAESAEALRKDIARSLTSQEEEWERMRRERAMLDKIAEALDADIADELLEDETRALLEGHMEQLERRGMTLAQWIEQTGKDQKVLLEELRDQAGKRLRTRLGIQDLLETKGIALTDDEIEQAITLEIDALPSAQANMAAELRNPASEARSQFLWQKRVEKLLAALLD